MTTTTVKNGQTYTSTVAAGDTVDVLAGGTTKNLQLAGTEIVENNGTAKGTIVEAGGVLTNMSGGTVTGVNVLSGGSFTNDGHSTGGTVEKGGSETIGATGDTKGIDVLGTLTDNGIGSGNTVGQGGTLVVGAHGSEANVEVVGGTLDASAAGAGLTGTVKLDGTGNSLKLDVANAAPTKITGLNQTDGLDIAGLSGATETVKGDTVTFKLAGGGTYTLDIVGASKDGLTFASDGHGGTTIGNNAPVCFMPGTAIATENGPVAVETLASGDLVLTSDGNFEPIRWVGRQTISTVFADPLRVSPIRIRAHAIAAGVPCRDLRVSADHAFLVEGILVHAGAMVNGTSILREDDLPEIITYFHVELASHALILAENTQAETFIDNVDRLAFDNWDEHQALDDQAPMVEMAYPRAKSHRQVPAALRRQLDTRAALLFSTAPETENARAA